MNNVLCPGCKILSADECQHLRDELSFYTLTRGDAFFIHQVLVDAYAAQHANINTKPIATAFALIGLHLLLDCGYTGKEVQLAHMRLAKRSKVWPSFIPPKGTGELTVKDVLAVKPGTERDAMIRTWAASVWAAWKKEHDTVAELTKKMDR